MPAFDLPGGYRLRPLELDDAEELAALVDANRPYLAEWMPWARESSVEGYRAYLEHVVAQAPPDEGFQAAVVDANGAICGAVGFHGVDWNNRATSIGYWLAESEQGRGTMTEAVRALVDHAFREWHLNRVEIRVAVGNARSAGVPARLGFVQEGILRQVERHADGFKDNVVYSLLASEWT
jgi:ribosomal-protein-serine acetyltransferase